MLAVIAGLSAAAMLGNDVALLTTRGSSMHPSFRTGDLAITVASDRYEVGDVAAYRAEPNGAIVLHRIVAAEGGRFTFQGDNNDWKDPTHPRTDEMVGKLWVRIPGAGVIADYTGAPGRAVLLTAGVVILLVGGEATRRSRRRGSGDGGGSRRSRRSIPTTSELGEAATMFALPGLAVAASLLLLGLAFTRPDTRETTEKREYRQEVTYGYTGTAPTGTTYPEGTVTTGSPIFLRLVQQIRFQIGYELTAEDPVHNAAGIYSIDAELSGVGSWKRTLTLQPATRFSGSGFSTEVTLDVPQIQALVAATQAETGVKGDAVTIDLVPRVTTNGFAGGVPFSATFDTPMSLKLTPLDITPVQAPEDDDGLDERTTSTYRAPVERTRNMTLLGRSASVSTVRTFSAVAALAALAWFGVVSATYQRLRRGSAALRLAHRYQSNLVDVAALPPLPEPVDVADMAALARIAERTERLILHHADGGVHTFLVEDDGTVYRVVLDDAPTDPPTDAPADPPTDPPADPPAGLRSATTNAADRPRAAPQAAPQVATPPPYHPPEPAPPPPPPPPAITEPTPEPESPMAAGLEIASGDASDAGSLFAALLGAGFLDVAPPPPDDAAPLAGMPPPYTAPEPPGPPNPSAPDIVVRTLDDALRLTPLTETERRELGLTPSEDGSINPQ